MNKFRNLIVLGPLIYLVHHFEEHIIFNFREWRLNYFADNNALSTEEVLIRLAVVLLLAIYIHLIKQNKASAHIVLFFLMTTQVVNACFHVFFSFYFQDFSPGAITGVLLYLPVNYLIFKAALREGYLNGMREVFGLFLIGATTFALFEAIGPIVMQGAVLLSVVYYFSVSSYDKKQTNKI
jgi:hypothetical protein